VTQPASTLTSTPVPSPTPLTCLEAGGRVITDTLESELLPQPLDYRIYLPPCYDELEDQRYPVLYLIHGQSFNDDQWQRLGATEIADRLVGRGELPPFIIVMPRDRIWLEPAEDPFGQALVEELIPHIDAAYRTIPERAARTVGGLSRGGAWALHLGLSEWETFGAVGLHSGFAFQSDIAHVKLWLDAIPLEQMPRFYLDVSDNDRPEIAQSATWFERLLTERGIAHEWYLFPGYHEETYWAAHVEQYLRWYAQGWKD
jgi:enterochelin esterase-like enzyme